MHTYLKNENRNIYTVGLWLINRDGYHQFNPLFEVENRFAAMSAVNMLNGGDTLKAFKIGKEF